MGRKPKVSSLEAVQVIQKYIHHFESNTFPSAGDCVRKMISKDLGHKWTPHTCYVHVRDNKKNHLMQVRKNNGIDTPAPEKKLMNDCSDNIPSVSQFISDGDLTGEEMTENSDYEKDDMLDEFHLKLSASEWELIKPNSDNTDPKSSKRLKKYVWSNVITRAFWNRYKMKCAFIGKWSSVTINDQDSVTVRFRAICRDKKCQNRLIGHTSGTPAKEGLNLIIKTRDTRNEYHSTIKRTLNGIDRINEKEKFREERPARYRAKLLRNNMEFGEDVPYFIQNNHVYRQAKSEAVREDLGIKRGDAKDMGTRIREMKANPKYAASIHDVGGTIFSVFYCSPEQIHVYKEYCPVVQQSRVCLDATGKLITKFEIYPGKMTGHIFLYTIAINFEKTTISVNQLLTERQDGDFLTLWLRDWIRRFSVPAPKEAVCDQERALLLGICQAFNKTTLKSYIDTCFSWAKNEEVKKNTPFPAATAIRIDVAHSMASVAK
uniref:MULE transposase domain-containing protein n=1 Tax=Bracon brevicornis TaxID=1563983 RepID=A0A6V7JIZ3_9HYME